MAKEISNVIKSLQATAVNRCRERLDEAAFRARDLISTGENGREENAAYAKPEYGVTSVLKRRHGL